MPLTLAAAGEENIIRKVGGNPEVKKASGGFGLRCRRYRYDRFQPEWKRDCKSQGITRGDQ